MRAFEDLFSNETKMTEYLLETNESKFEFLQEKTEFYEILELSQTFHYRKELQERMQPDINEVIYLFQENSKHYFYINFLN